MDFEFLINRECGAVVLELVLFYFIFDCTY